MRRKHLTRVFLAAAVLTAAVWAFHTPIPAQAGIKLYKAKESETSYMSGGKKIKVLKFAPSEGEGPFPGIALIHGLDGIDLLEKDKSIQLLYKTVAGKIADKGFVVYIFYYFQRTPMSEIEAAEVKKQFLDHVPRMKAKPFDAKLQKLYEEWMDTVQDGIAFMRKDPKEVVGDKIGVLGLSLGGFLGASLAVDRPAVNIAALVDVFGGLPPQLYEKAQKAKNLPPLMVMGGEEDEIVPVIFQRELYGLWSKTEFCREAHFYGNLGHAFFDKQRGAIDMDVALNEMLPTAIRFLKRHVAVAPVKK